MFDDISNIGVAGAENQPGAPFHDSKTASVINQAALLDAAAYELKRGDLARAAGMRLGSLDRSRKARRKEIADERKDHSSILAKNSSARWNRVIQSSGHQDQRHLTGVSC